MHDACHAPVIYINKLRNYFIKLDLSMELIDEFQYYISHILTRGIMPKPGPIRWRYKWKAKKRWKKVPRTSIVYQYFLIKKEYQSNFALSNV